MKIELYNKKTKQYEIFNNIEHISLLCIENGFIDMDFKKYSTLTYDFHFAHQEQNKRFKYIKKI